MNRRRLLVPILGILAANPALGTDFHLDARVDVVPALSIELAPHRLDGGDAPTLRIADTQERCLSVSWSADGQSWQGVPPSARDAWTPPPVTGEPVILRIDLD